ncbi:MAG: hypothetical protein GTO63_15745 [Anaerolineae bacterium]|nr:hypothetical protein [Anaerolineae bacterium]NIN96282.1 hypothetical protein [Anaerolineae bacterium]NIQ79302.1 hypothetical protein [Anaerolineae bacterium]
MANIGSAFTDLGVALKVIYPSKALEPMINEEAPFREKLNKSTPAGARVTEGDVKFNGVLALPQNVAQILDEGDLQTARGRNEVQFNLRPTIFQATMNIGWLTRRAANTGKSAWEGGELQRRTEETASNLGKYVESHYVGTTGDGVRAYVESAVAGSITVRKPEGTKLLRQGQKVSVRDGTALATERGTSATTDGVRIKSLDYLTRKIIFETEAGVTVTDHTAGASVVADDAIMVVSADGLGDMSGTFANGLRGLVDDGTYNTDIHGQDRTATGNEKLKSIVSSNGGTLRNLTEQLLIRVNHQVHEESGKRPTDIWTTPGQVEKYIEFVAPDRRRAVQSGSYDKGTGYKEGELVHYAPGIALRINRSFDLIPRELFLLSWDTFFHYVAQETQWVDEGSLLHLAISSTGNRQAKWEAFMACMENIGNDMPVANAVIRDLSDPQID